MSFIRMIQHKQPKQLAGVCLLCEGGAADRSGIK